MTTVIEPFGRLSLEEQQNRLTRLATRALDAYGLDATVAARSYTINATFAVEAATERFALRLYRPETYDAAAIRSEAVWLRHLAAAGERIAEPLPGTDGELVQAVTAPDGVEPRHCVLFRWLEGSSGEALWSPALAGRLGETMARLHAASEGFAAPEGFVRPHFGVAELLSPVVPEDVEAELLTQRSRRQLDEAAEVLREELAGLETRDGACGLIHGDLTPKNVLLHDGEISGVLDFTDCGSGPYLYDAAVTLQRLAELPEGSRHVEEFLAGYRRVRPLAEEHEKFVEAFQALHRIHLLRLLVRHRTIPAIRTRAAEGFPSYLVSQVERYVRRRRPAQAAVPPADASLAGLTTVQLLAHLQERDVEVWTEDGRLRFNAPKGAMTDELRAELKRRKEVLLTFLRRTAKVRSAPPVVPVPHEGPLPLSFAQERLWFLDRLEPGQPVYNLSQAMRFTGELDAGVLKRSLAEVARRHAVLRTTFTVAGDQPRQVIHSELEIPLEELDFSALSPAERLARLEESLAAERRRPFDLVHDALLRVSLFRLEETDWVINTVVHHIVADGWSSSVLIRELLVLYQAFHEGRPSPLPELAIQYADFAHWQRSYLTGQVLAEQLDYWKRELAGAPHSLELPTDRPRARQVSYEGGKYVQKLPSELADALQRLNQEHGTTLFMTLLAAFQVLLARHTGQDDIVVGSPIANRNHFELEELIGFFVNTLVLRGRIEPRITFRKLLEQAHRSVVGAFDHQDLPFEKLVEELRPERVRHQNPLFQVAFSHQSFSPPAGEGFELEVAPLSSKESLEPFEMTLYCWEQPAGIELSWHYRRALFDATTVRRMAAHLQALLAAMVTDLDRPCAAALVSDAERHQLLHESNDVRTAFPRQSSVPELFAVQVAASPDAVALRFDDATLSYGELDVAANRLARHLVALGVGPGVAVGVLVERSARMVVAFLAVLKAGGAYVPLDSEYPDVRLKFMLEDTAAPVVLVEEASRERLERLAGAPSRDKPGFRLVSFDGDREAITARPTGDPAAGAPACRLAGEDLAYVIYTSGSTGRPKGVAVPHRAIVRLVRETNYVDLGPTDRIAQLSNASFDAATFEVWGSLLNGATLLGVPKDVALSPPVLARALEVGGVTALFITTALFNQVVREAPQAFAGLRCVLFGGEAVDPQRVREALAAGGPERLLHVYGPTENTTFSSWFRVREVAAEATTVPIGAALANSSLYVLDADLEPVPIGVGGELLLGGDGLASGYLRRPGLTAERFVPHPLADTPGERLYRTGDLVRRNRTDEVEFLGRVDHQVKLRGFRIELGEVEATVARHPRVRDAAALIHQGATGEKSLVAWLAAAEPSPTAGELRGFLRETLPDYMVPARFVCLDELPLTPNGKVDRTALATRPLPEETGPEEAMAYGEPTEEILAGIWAELLGRRKVAVNEDFFELGGHSLLATQLMSRVRELFQIDLPLQELFEGPTVSAFARAVQATRLKAQDWVAPPLVAVPRGGELPLSFAQQRLWFFDQLQPGSAVYNVPSAVRLHGPISAPLLERITGEVVRRHEVLRTIFVAERGRPRQVIAEERALPLPVIDLRGLDAERRRRETRRLADTDADRPFDLAGGPLIRFALIALAAEEHVVLVNMHHIVSDGWSTGIFLKEMATLYDAFSRGAASPLPELELQYADYAHWQRGWLSEEVLDAELAFWKEALDGAPGVLELPTDRPRPAVESFRGRTRPWCLPAALTGELHTLSQRRGATLFMTLLAAFDVLLGRWSGQDDIVVGTPIAGRHHKEIEGLIGFFVNTLVLRARLTGGAFGELVDELRRTALDAYAHQDLPFERLVEEVAPERDLSISPVFQVMFALRHAAGEIFRVPRLEIRQLARQGTSAKFDLLLSLQHDEAGVSGSLEYSTDLFDDTTMARLLSHYERLLEAAVADPEGATAEWSVLGAGERHQLLVEWRGERTDFPRGSTVPELFTAQVAATPDAPALLYGEEIVTYRELNERANRLAHHLQGLGVGPEVLVGVAMERSPKMLVALVAILKAGGAYLPLEASYPEERLIFLLEDTATPVVLTCGPAREQMESLARMVVGETYPAFQVVDLERDAETLAGLDSSNPPAAVGADHLAYVLYTSGSTGEPKGVAAVHRAVVRLVREPGYAELGAEQVFLQFAPVAFDASTLEIWGPLLNGGSLAIYPGAQASLEELGEVVARYGVNTLWLTAGLFHRMVEDRPEALRGIGQLLAGGDVLSPAHVEKALAELPGTTLVNGYGPTENTTFTCCHPMRTAAEVTSPVAIGRPIADTSVHLLDRRLQPVPVGVAGELLTGGDGLARGYFNRPALTAEKFRPNPFAVVPGERLYHTGDLARFRGDGTVEFLGRRDHQIKLRGFRIELGEIETTLGRYPGIRQNVVHLWQRPAAPGRAADKRLAAYLVSEVEPPPGAEELRTFLGEILPDYMVPSAFVFLDEVPLNPSGKVDRKALPAPEMVAQEKSSRPPNGPTEELLAGIWEEILGRERVGALDNFFELGGHSLLATQVVSRVREAFGVELLLRQLFEAPSVAELVEVVEAMRRAEQGREAPPIVATPRDGDLALSFAQQRLWFLDQLEPDRAVYNIPGAVRLEGTVDVALLESVFAEIVRRHESLRTVFPSVAGEARQVILPELELPFVAIDLRGLPEAAREAEIRRLSEAEARTPFDLAVGPLFHIRLLHLAETDHVMLVTMHHVVSDGWSMGVFYEELCACYTAFKEGKPSPLAELPVQYADFAQWQRQWLSGEVLEAEIAFWEERLRDVPRRLDLPLDRPRPAFQTFVGRLLGVRLPRQLSKELAAMSRQRGSTLYMTLLAAFKLLMARHSGQRDIVIGSPVAGRNRREIEGLIGFFVNTLVLRTTLEDEATFPELLDRVRQVALDAYSHQDLPFERLVEMVPERDLSASPLFQVMFALQNAPRGALELPGLTLRQLPTDAKTSKFDLLLSLQEGEEGLSGVLEFNTDLFDGTTMRRLLAHYERLLEAILEDPARRLSTLPWWSPGERQQLLAEWNDGAGAEIGADTLHGLVAAQAERTPEATALVVGEDRTSYGELCRRRNQMAHELRGLGVGPEVRVGVCLERDAELVVAILGVLEAGGAYVPVDPAYPRERLAFMLEDASVEVIVTREALAGTLPEVDAAVLRLDADAARIEAQPPTAPPRAGGPENLAYVIYTSGSTGRPKGVAIEHRSAAALVRWSRRVFTGDELAGVAATTSVCFDLSVFELFVPLACGGTVLLVENALALASLAAAGEVRLVNSVPSAVTELARFGELPGAARTINLAGEPLKRQLVDELRRQGVERILNLYGPSEDTTYSTFVEVPAEPGEPTIGRPVDGTDAWVLDRHGRPSPIGVPGELSLGGRGLARGYLGRPARTAESFVPHPWSAAPGGRLYRTGDLVRWRTDGELEFLGRVDHQVKVRGFRIELGEIEAALERHPVVRESAVLLREDVVGDPRLVAYAAPAEVEAAELRESLRKRLPDFMLPSAFVLLDALPLTPNGKLDRKALPAPTYSSQERTFVAPTEMTEQILAGIWSEVLGLERLSVEDDFFALGGHSLLATQVASRARGAFGVETPLQWIFEAPTVAKLAAKIREARKHQEGLDVSPIEPVPRDRDLPLSFAQQRMWFLDQLEPGSSAYNVPRAVRLRGEIEASFLERVLNEVVRRHEALRTTFALSADGRPVQLVAAELRLTVPEVDLGALPEARREAEGRRWATRLAWQPFDLAVGPLLRSVLVRLAEDDVMVVVSIHHIVTDGWSMDVFFRELSALISAWSRGEPSPLAPLAVQYADFAQWQRGWLDGAELETRLAYWRTQLENTPKSLELPTDRPRTATRSLRGTSLPLHLSAELADRLAVLNLQHGVTPFMTLLAAFKTLLARYTGAYDVVVGFPIAGRNRKEIEDLVGLFVNTLVLRTRFAPDFGFHELLGRVRQVALDAYTHQDLPFERLVDEIAPDRDLSTSPMFQVMFVLQNAPRGSLKMADLELSSLDLTVGGAKFDMTLVLVEEEGFAGALEYSTDLFDASTVRRFLKHFEALLTEIVADPSRPLVELQLMSPAERHQLCREWNDTPLAGRFAGLCLHQLVEAQAERAGEAVAWVAGEVELSFAELNRRANRLAHHLRRLGAGPDVPVGICMHRSLNLVVGILGILKSGSAYLPLDPKYPAERLQFMVEDVRAPLLLTEESLRPSIPESEAAVLYFETLALDEERNDNPQSGVGERDLAYFIYTSGSTGRPKGVSIEHRSAVTLVDWATGVFSEQECDGLLFSTSVCFDLSVFELFLPASRGNRTILAENALQVSQLPSGDRVTLVNTSPSVMAELERQGAIPASVRTVNLAGEPLPGRLAEALYQVETVERVLNLYGPSEDTTYSTWAQAERHSRRAPTIGRPLAGTQAYVLDPRLRPVPVGVHGELCLGGLGLARFYYDRPGLTGEKFIPDPWSREGGDRLYRTGDLTRFLGDGQIDFLGRIDHQIKIRGLRIEPGEIEALIARHPAVDEVAVVMQQSQTGAHLVAFLVVAEGTEEPPEGELRQRLEESLPSYMVPAAFVWVEQMPQTPSGKIDRHHLAGLESVKRDDGGERVQPRNPLELELLQIWQEVLEIRDLGVTDNFFKLGGHSLLAIYLMVCIRERLDHDLPVAVLFQAPTIETLAAALEQEHPRSQYPSLVPLAPGGEKAPFFCVHGAGGNVFYFVELARHLSTLDADRPFYGIQARGLMGEEGEALRTVDEMADYYLEVVRHRQPQGPYFLGGYSSGCLVAFEMGRRLRDAGDEVAFLGMFDALADPMRQVRVFNQTALLAFFARELMIPVMPDELVELPDDEQLSYILEKGWRLKKIPREFSFDDANQALRIMEATLDATRTAELGSYPGKVTVFRSESSDRWEEDLGWGGLAAEVEVHGVTGNHRTMFVHPNVEKLGELLVTCFERAE